MFLPWFLKLIPCDCLYLVGVKMPLSFKIWAIFVTPFPCSVLTVTDEGIAVNNVISDELSNEITKDLNEKNKNDDNYVL